MFNIAAVSRHDETDASLIQKPDGTPATWPTQEAAELEIFHFSLTAGWDYKHNRPANPPINFYWKIVPASIPA